MKKLALSILALLAIENHSFLIAQRGNCSGEHNFCFPEKDKKKGGAKDVWQYNNQSKSGLFAENETTEITVVTYKDTEYMLAFCSDNEMLEGKIQFKLYDFVTKQVEKKRPGKIKFADPTDSTGVRMLERDTVYKDVAYEKSKKLLFDNTKKENVQHFEFISEKTRKLLVEVFIPSSGGGSEASTGKKNTADDKEIQAATYSCVGMLVMHQKALVTGFQK
ncbi:MAG TPA: hypothetical protein VK177_10040 [Flavobacteriales bacterium]|nr:hypothetical protein [Flavobacteriales bacterium]